MSIREEWAKNFAEQGKLLYELDSDGDLALFVSKDKPINDPKAETPVEGWNCRNPMFHVWNGDKWMLCTANSDYAYHYFVDEGIHNRITMVLRNPPKNFGEKRKIVAGGKLQNQLDMIASITEEAKRE